MSDQELPASADEPASIVEPPASHLGRIAPDVREERPPPALASLAGAFAGFLLLASLFYLLADLGGGSRRTGGIVLALLFELLGVALILMNRNQRGATAGVLLTALGLVPLLVYLFVDVRNPGRTINSVGKFTSTTTLILVVAAVLWLAAYFFGPARRYGFYLGAALIALWLVAIVQIVDEPLQNVLNPFVASSTFLPIGPTTDFGGSSSGRSSSRSCTTDEDGVTTCTSFGTGTDFGSSSSDPFGQSSPFDESPSTRPLRRPEDPSTKIGVASLLFGAAYLALAGLRDRRGDRRQATVFFAAAIPILTIGVLFLTGPLDTIGTSLLAIALGAITIWLATRSGRRFSSWYATIAAVIAVLALVNKLAGASNRVSAAVLAVIALGTVLLLRRLDGGTDADAESTGGFPMAPWASPTPVGAASGVGSSEPSAGGAESPKEPPGAGTGTGTGSSSSTDASNPWEPPAGGTPPAGEPSPGPGPAAADATPGPSFAPPPPSGWAPPASTDEPDPTGQDPDAPPTRPSS